MGHPILLSYWGDLAGGGLLLSLSSGALLLVMSWPL
jgi:hypothetical protein